MSLRYSHDKTRQSEDAMWTSYSDLFLGLSIIFLLLFVTASLRQGTDGIRQYMEFQQMSRQVEDLKQQVKVYDALKQEYLETQASADEIKTYEALMSRLDLLKDEASEEKKRLRRMAKENEEKEQALNQYQQIIRNIINTNLISKARIQTRNRLIDTKDSEIATKDQTIVKLEQDISAKETQINQKENQIGKLQADLAKKVSELDQAFKRQQISKKAFEEQKRKLEADTNRRIQALEGEKQGLYQNLAKVAQDLDATRAELAIQAGRAAEIGAQKEALENELGKAREQIQNQREELLGEFAKQRAADRKAFEDALNKERLSGAERAAREDAFRRAAAAKEQELKGKLADLDKQLGATQAELGKALDRLNAQKKLADSLKKNLEARGVQADVDAKTGDVLISFGDTYFDTGRADLKPEMKRVLEQAMPAYAQSLFSDPKVAEKVSSVEIIGFASPTYRGRFVNPNSLEAKDREAVNYNLDLSYARARSIFNYVFDKEKMQFPNQERLLPLVKVTGRSFFPHTKDRIRGVANDESFCQRNDCAQLQKVIIKFNLKD